MALPTTSELFNQTTPAAPSGDQNVAFVSDGQTPLQSISAYPKRMVGDSGSGGLAGTVPAPAAGDGAARKWLKATGAWLAIAAADLAGAIFGASGASHSAGAVPDPGASAGTTRYLREDATWAVPSSATGMATQSGVQQEAYTYAADTGAANAYAVTLSPTPTIVAGSRVTFKAANANSGASTLAVNGGSATAILKDGTAALSANDINVGQIVTCVYDGTHWQAQGLTPALVLTPVIRGTSQATANAASITITLPTGSQAGDLAILFAAGGWEPTVPSGWTTIYPAPGSYQLEMCACSKLLTSGDVSTGSVTVSFSGSYNMVATMVTFIGATGGVRENEATTTTIASGGSNLPVVLTTTGAVQNTDAAIYFTGIRSSGTTVFSITPGSGSATTLQNATGGVIQGLMADQSMPGGVLAVDYNYTNYSTATPIAAIQVIVEGVASSIGTVSSVGLTVPARQTVSGSPVTGAGTLVITDNTQSANLVFAGPASGSAAAPTFRAMVAADIPATAVTPGSYTNANIAIGADGRVTAASNGSTAGISLTTTGTSGAATLVSNVLNIPQYTGGVGVSGALILLEEHTASNSATLDFTTAITSSYDEYMIELVNVVPATNAIELLMEFSTNGGTSYDTTSGYYEWGTWRWLAGSSGVSGSTSDTAFRLGGGFNVIPNTASLGGVVGSLKIYNPLSGSMHTRITGKTQFSATSTTPSTVEFAVTGSYLVTTAVNAIRFIASSGNISSGTIRIYGLTH